MVRGKYQKKTPFFLILGATNAGKTSLLYRLYSGIFYNSVQLVNRNIEEARVDNIRLRTLNIMENNLTKEIWGPLTVGCSGVIFIIDLTKTTNVTDSYALFHELRSSSSLVHIPFAIFANKNDLQKFNELNLLKDLSLPDNEHDQNYIIQSVSCKTTEGIIEGITWLMEKTGVSFYIPKFRK